MSRLSLMPPFSRLMIGFLAAGLCAAIGEPSARAGKRAVSRPNIILCMADDQGYGDVGYYGNPIPKTPVLDEMARSGLRFDRFYAAAPVCSPTRGSVLTGRHPNRFGCFSWGFTLRPQEITVAEVLKKAGYTTGHFGKWHLGSLEKSSPVNPGHSGFDEWVSSPNFYDNSPLMSHNGKVVRLKGESSLVTVNAALDFIRKASGQKQPFLAVIWFGSPHLPHKALPAERKLYKDLPVKLQNYYGEITGIDRAMGHLRHELRRLKIAENTLLWYTSDNGPRNPLRRDRESAGGLSGRKATLWEGGIRVPTIIEWPARVRSPRTTSVPCSTVDIYPTLLSLTGMTVPDQPRPLDGIDLMPLIDGKMTSRSKPLGFWVYTARGHGVRSADLLEDLAAAQAAGRPPKSPQPATGQLSRRYSETRRPGHAAWMEGRYKLHRIPQKDGRFTYRLFDLVKDRREKTDLSAQQPERTERMKRALADWQRSVIGSLNGRDYPRR